MTIRNDCGQVTQRTLIKRPFLTLFKTSWKPYNNKKESSSENFLAPFPSCLTETLQHYWYKQSFYATLALLLLYHCVSYFCQNNWLTKRSICKHLIWRSVAKQKISIISFEHCSRSISSLHHLWQQKSLVNDMKRHLWITNRYNIYCSTEEHFLEWAN